MKGQNWYQEDFIANQYDEMRFSNGGQLIDSKEKQQVLDLIDIFEGKKILEIACGTARFGLMLAELGADVTGIDISKAMINIGRKKIPNSPLTGNLNFLYSDASSLPFKDSSFDIVLAMRFFHLTPHIEYFLPEMIRVSNDKVIFDTFNAYSARFLYNWILPMDSKLHKNSDISKLLLNINTKSVKSTNDFFFPYGLYRKLPFLFAKGVKYLDSRMTSTDVGKRFSTVSYWSISI
jgi:ubiquinone/menaquinone biosynthesis C-methylase UbiE